MPILELLPSKPRGHLKISPEARFYINHIEEHADSAAHDHNYLELAFVMHGSAKHLTVNGESPCRAGDVFIIPVGVWHGYSKCRNLELYNCLLSPDLLQKELAWLANHASMRDRLGIGQYPLSQELRHALIPKSKRGLLRQRLEQLLNSFQNPTSPMTLLGNLLLLLDFLSIGSCEASTQARREHASVLKALVLIHRDISQDWSLTQLAAEIGLSPTYLVSLFRTSVDSTPMKYIENQRAEQAATLLLSTQMRIGEIGERVGWPEPKQFARAFKRHFGISASTYRKRMMKTFKL